MAENHVPGTELASTGLLSFYDRLRDRIRRRADRGGSRLAPAAAEALLVAPDLFVFLVRLAMDPEVPREQRRLIGGALLYFVVPVDLVPEAVLGVGGFLDDLVLASAVLGQAFGDELEIYARRYWNGSRKLATVIGDLSRGAEALLSGTVYRRLRRALTRRGLEL